MENQVVAACAELRGAGQVSAAVAVAVPLWSVPAGAEGAALCRVGSPAQPTAAATASSGLNAGARRQSRARRSAPRRTHPAAPARVRWLTLLASGRSRRFCGVRQEQSPCERSCSQALAVRRNGQLAEPLALSHVSHVSHVARGYQLPSDIGGADPALQQLAALHPACLLRASHVNLGNRHRATRVTGSAAP